MTTVTPRHCSVCRAVLPADRDHRYCRECHASYQRHWRRLTAAPRSAKGTIKQLRAALDDDRDAG